VPVVILTFFLSCFATLFFFGCLICNIFLVNLTHIPWAGWKRERLMQDMNHDTIFQNQGKFPLSHHPKVGKCFPGSKTSKPSGKRPRVTQPE